MARIARLLRAAGFATTSPPVPVVSPNGELLIAVGRNFDDNGAPEESTVHIVSMTDGTSRPLADFDGPTPVATWSSDGDNVVFLETAGPPDYNRVITTLASDATESEAAVVTELDTEHLLLAAG